ncbi:hypothetical protein WH96_15655 [Kiloniella spongiae]|uniref:DUF4424 domain-containing protein n=1 Tax=Kiloniella spongiae TaxID=1489064 RepID=A0A0H2MBT7_9PROT|nr:hypothetical protein [Kiloniella spongiae]KLN59818.1 hypothetical protein WH96_15655 [Kiloniella spongiae]
MSNSSRNPFKYFVRLSLTVLVLMMNASAGAEESSGFVKAVNLELRSDNIVLQVNRSDGSDNIEFLTVPPYLELLADGYVKCSIDAKIVPENTEIYFGTFDRILYGETYPPHLNEWNASTSEWETKYSSDPQVFRVPLSNISNGHSSLRVDVKELMQKKLLGYLEEGKTFENFYQDSHEIILSRAITLITECESKGERFSGYDTETINIVIRYKGDQNFSGSKSLDRQIANFNKSFLKLTDVSIFQPSLMYSGVCHAETTSPVRFSYTAVGIGAIRFVLLQNEQTIAGSQIIPHNSEIPLTIATEILYPLGAHMLHRGGQGSFMTQLS